jgi:hypothetical protein
MNLYNIIIFNEINIEKKEYIIVLKQVKINLCN